MLLGTTGASSSRDDFIPVYIEMTLAQKSIITAEIYVQDINAISVPIEP
jgi:hypothetical protein